MIFQWFFKIFTKTIQIVWNVEHRLTYQFMYSSSSEPVEFCNWLSKLLLALHRYNSYIKAEYIKQKASVHFHLWKLTDSLRRFISRWLKLSSCNINIFHIRMLNNIVYQFTEMCKWILAAVLLMSILQQSRQHTTSEELNPSVV